VSDAIHYAFETFEDINVPEPYDAVAVMSKLLRTFLIVLSSVSVLPSVELNDDFGIVAGKIGNISGQWHLPAEVTPFGFEQA
jgi:hypothetical protein